MIRLNRLLAIPALLWFTLFVAIPLVIVFLVSLISRDNYGSLTWVWTLENYRRVLGTAYLLILLDSLKLALLTTLGCLLLGLPLAWAMATAGKRWRSFFLLMMTLPFLTNLVIRVYAIRVFVGYDGPLQSLLSFLHVPFDPFTLSQNEPLVFYGMLTTYLPFMVLPLYSAFEKFDFSLVEAAQDLGAGPWKILIEVIAPNLRRSLVSGALLVFVPSFGEYVIPDLLGGAKTLLYGNLITHQFLRARDWPFGSALSIVLMLVLFAFAFFILRLSEVRRD